MYLSAYDRIVAEMRKDQTKAIDKCSRTSKEGALIWCSKVTEESAPYCSACAKPKLKWRNGDCNVADYSLKTVAIAAQEKKRVGQQKSRKKKNR